MVSVAIESKPALIGAVGLAEPRHDLLKPGEAGPIVGTCLANVDKSALLVFGDAAEPRGVL